MRRLVDRRDVPDEHTGFRSIQAIDCALEMVKSIAEARTNPEKRRRHVKSLRLRIKLTCPYRPMVSFIRLNQGPLSLRLVSNHSRRRTRRESWAGRAIRVSPNGAIQLCA